MSREHQNRQKRDLECPCSAGGTRFYTHHTRPFYRPFPQASDRSSAGLRYESSLQYNSFALRQQESVTGYTSRDIQPSVVLWSCDQT